MSKVEICVAMDMSNPKHQFHKVIITKDFKRSYSIRVKELDTKVDYDDIEDQLFFTPKDTTPDSHSVHESENALINDDNDVEKLKEGLHLSLIRPKS